VNYLAVDWCGYTTEQVLDRPFWDTPWWRGSEEMKARIRFATKQAASGSVFREELRYWVADGSERIVDFAMHPIRDRSGAVLLLHPTGIDITERKQIEELRESEQRLRWLASIVESSDDAIVSKNLDGIIASWNRGAERTFGYSAEEAIGQPITIIIPQDRRDEERVILTRIRRGERIDHFETVRQRKHGSLIVVSLTVSPVKNAEGKIVGASKIARDVTEQKRSQEQIATLAREAEHRSKNLLSTIQATVHLSQSDTPEGLKQAIEGTYPSVCERSLAICRDALDWCRVIDHRGAGACSLLREGRNARAHSRSTSPIRARRGSGHCCNLARASDQCRQYGALSAAKGQIDLKWSHEADGRLILCWAEMGGPAVPVQTPTRQGFGSRVIERMIGQLKGKTRFDWRPEGLVCEITLQA
jgi:PAS domain S-box-containing protein